MVFGNIFIDVVSTKTGSKRSEFNRMINEYEYGNLDTILTKSLSRFWRDAKEGLEAIRRIQAAGKRIIFEKDKIDTKTVKDELVISIIEACKQAENDWRNKNIRLSLKYKAEDGTSGLYNRACYGYKKDKNVMLIIDEK